MSKGYSLRTYNTTGVLVQVRRSTAEDPAGDAAAAQLREFGTAINAVRGAEGMAPEDAGNAIADAVEKIMRALRGCGRLP